MRDKERLQGIAEGTSSAPRLASSSATSFPERNECPGIPCSLIAKNKEDSSCQREQGKRKDEEEVRVAMIERASKKRSGRLVGTAETSKELAQWCRLQRKNLLGLQKRKEWSQCHNESSWQVRQNRPSQKVQEQSHQCRLPNCEVGESQGEREEDESGSIEKKKWTPQRRKAGSEEERQGRQREPPQEK